MFFFGVAGKGGSLPWIVVVRRVNIWMNELNWANEID